MSRLLRELLDVADRLEAGTRTLFGTVTERMLEHPLPSPVDTVPLALRWFMVAGAWWASRDDVDGWREHLRGLPW
ncbi:MAG: hypothetical protein JWM62_306 [Frankiales bacterium]|nr:hypothetical protein [Frankiales bacterium]